MKRPIRRELVFQLVETSRFLHGYVDHRARDHGTTRAQWGVLARLRGSEGVNQASLAEALAIQPISLVRHVDRLAKQGLVERRPAPKDRRAHLLHLTPAGRALVDDLDALRGAIADDVLDGIDESALTVTLATLAAIRARIGAKAPPGDPIRSPSVPAEHAA